MVDEIKRAINGIPYNRLINFVVVMCCGFVLLGNPVPTINEYFYLVRLIKSWDESYILNDWTLSGGYPEHFFFNFVFSPLSVIMPINVLGWVGRIVCWGFIIVGLFRIGARFDMPKWLVSVSIILWICIGQSIVGEEWMLWLFEAKSVSYIFILFSLECFLRGKRMIGSALLGISISFHPAVGFWSALAIFLARLWLKQPILLLTKEVTTTAIFSLPGIIPILLILIKNAVPNSSEAQFMVLVKFPYHLDPFSWEGSKILLACTLPIFAWCHLRIFRHNESIRFLTYLEVALLAIFLLGLIARFLNQYEFLVFYPFRVFAVLTPIFFLFHLMAFLYESQNFSTYKWTASIGVAILLMFVNPVQVGVQQLRANVNSWMKKEDHIAKSFRWIKQNTPRDAIVIMPPWREDGWYLAERAQIATYVFPPYDRFGEWIERVECLGGIIEQGEWKEKYKRIAANFEGLKSAEIISAARKYGSNYLISSTKYPFPILFESGGWKVYFLAH